MENKEKKEILISDLDNKTLVEIISKSAQKMYECEDIECAYLMHYEIDGLVKIQVCAVLEKDYRKKPIKNELNKIKKTLIESNVMAKINNSTQISVEYFIDSNMVDYNVLGMHKRERVKMENLCNSSILFDKTGHLTKLREDFFRLWKEVGTFNFVSINPPIDECIKNKIKTLKSE
ncbi:MAG: hypothetical protein Q4E75_04785 [bacterium]|nr:hypothetical protein [bacterium]